MALDRVQPLKIEDPGTGGTQTDSYPTGTNRNEDFLDCHGVALQSSVSNDDNVFMTRDGNDMVFRDPVAGQFSLSQLAGGGFSIDDVVWDNAGGIVYGNDGTALMRG